MRFFRLWGANGMVDRKIASPGDAGGGRASPPDGCRRFLDGYSEYRDGRLDKEDRSGLVGHMARCSSCRRYDRVIRRGVGILREQAEAPPSATTSIAEVRRRATASERESLALGTAGSGVTLSAAVLVALLLAAVAWSPLFSGATREVDMPPVAAGAPTPPGVPSFAPLETRSAADLRRSDVWDTVHSLFVERGLGRVRESGAGADPN